MITADNGFYQVLENHTTPVSPAPFDPNATTGPPDNDPLYQLFLPLNDVNYDAAIFVPGSIQRTAGELLWQGIANRTMRLVSGNAHCYAYLDVGIASGTSIILSIERNRVEIGTITFTVGGLDTDGGKAGSFNIPTTVDLAEGDVWGIRVTQSDNAAPSGLSVTLPFLRTDI